MDIIIKSSKKVVTETMFRTIAFPNHDFVCHETYVDEVLQDQVWTVPKNFFPETSWYHDKEAKFRYYPDLSFLNTEDVCINDVRDIKWPKPVNVQWEDFDEEEDFDHVLMVSVGVDGNVWQITKNDGPMNLWHRADYTSTYIGQPDYFYLDEIVDKLNALDWIRNARLIEPDYSEGGHFIELEYFGHHNTWTEQKWNDGGEIKKILLPYRKPEEDY